MQLYTKFPQRVVYVIGTGITGCRHKTLCPDHLQLPFLLELQYLALMIS